MPKLSDRFEIRRFEKRDKSNDMEMHMKCKDGTQKSQHEEEQKSFSKLLLLAKQNKNETKSSTNAGRKNK